jgi:hypothetical protein
MSVVAVLAVIFGFKEMAQDGLSVLAAAAIAAGLAVAVGFVIRQRRLTDPMIDVGLFRRRVFDAALAANFLAIFIAAGYFLFVAQYLQLVIGCPPCRPGCGRCPRRSRSSSAANSFPACSMACGRPMWSPAASPRPRSASGCSPRSESPAAWCP